MPTRVRRIASLLFLSTIACDPASEADRADDSAGDGEDSQGSEADGDVTARWGPFAYRYSPDNPTGRWGGSNFGPASCRPGEVLVGAYCGGSNCQHMWLICDHGLAPRYDLEDRPTWGTYISEEDPGDWPTGCAWYETATGLSCADNKCDDVSMQCVPLTVAPTGDCYYGPYFSEEGAAMDEAAPGYAVVAMDCRGGYCDDVRFRYCRM